MAKAKPAVAVKCHSDGEADRGKGRATREMCPNAPIDMGIAMTIYSTDPAGKLIEIVSAADQANRNPRDRSASGPGLTMH